MVKTADKVRLKDLYYSKLQKDLQKKLELSNIMQVPRLKKIVLNVGVKEAINDSRVLDYVMDTLKKISGQAPVKTVARKSIAGFKIREGMPLGTMVTLRGKSMYSFLDRLINLALPKVRDFQGVPVKLDGQGNYNLGIKEWNIFPEADNTNDKIFGLNITVHTSTDNDDHSRELLKSFGMPFKKDQ
jgi:large subunit ribosomal protein L5